MVERLSEYLDDELVPGERASIEAHLRECAECARQLEEFAAVDDFARRLPIEAPEGYFTDFSSRVRARVEAKPAGRAPLRLPAWALAAAAAVALGVMVPALVRRQSLEPAAPPSSAPVASQFQQPAPAMADEQLAREAENRASSAPPASTVDTRRPRAEKSLAAPPPQAPPPQASAVQQEYAEPHGLAGGVAESVESGPAPAETGRAREADALKADTSEQLRALGYVSMEKKAKAEAPAFVPAPGAAASAPKRAADGMRKDQAAAGSLARTRFGELLDRPVTTAAEGRALREAWRVHASLASGGEADEARVRVLEAGAQAYRLGRDAADLALLEKDAAAYLARPDALQAARARAALLSVRGERP